MWFLLWRWIIMIITLFCLKLVDVNGLKYVFCIWTTEPAGTSLLLYSLRYCRLMKKIVSRLLICQRQHFIQLTIHYMDYGRKQEKNNLCLLLKPLMKHVSWFIDASCVCYQVTRVIQSYSYYTRVLGTIFKLSLLLCHLPAQPPSLLLSC